MTEDTPGCQALKQRFPSAFSAPQREELFRNVSRKGAKALSARGFRVARNTGHAQAAKCQKCDGTQGPRISTDHQGREAKSLNTSICIQKF